MVSEMQRQMAQTTSPPTPTGISAGSAGADGRGMLEQQVPGAEPRTISDAVAAARTSRTPFRGAPEGGGGGVMTVQQMYQRVPSLPPCRMWMASCAQISSAFCLQECEMGLNRLSPSTPASVGSLYTDESATPSSRVASPASRRSLGSCPTCGNQRAHLPHRSARGACSFGTQSRSDLYGSGASNQQHSRDDGSRCCQNHPSRDADQSRVLRASPALQ